MTLPRKTRLNFVTLETRTNPDGGLAAGGDLEQGHVDFLSIEFERAESPEEPAKLEFHAHDEESDEEYRLDGTRFIIKPEALIPRPEGSDFDFLGVPSSKSIWMLPQVQDPNLLFGGVGAEEVMGGQLGSYTETDDRFDGEGEFIRVEVVGFEGPGEFSAWVNDSFGQPVVFVQTADGINAKNTPSDTFFALPEAHQDMNLAFTEPGQYTLRVKATAYLNDNKLNPVESEVETLRFFVQETDDDVAPKIPSGIIATAPDVGGIPIVRVVNPVTGNTLFEIPAYEPTFLGGVNVAVGDVTGDGNDDIVTGAGAGGGPRIEIFDGVSGKSLGSFFAYEPSFTGGVTVALGDLNGDGRKDIITGTGIGGGPRIVAFSGVNRQQIANFFAYEASFRGGVNVSADDLNNDGIDDIAVGSGVGGGPRVVVVDGKSLGVLRNFFAYEPSFRGGVNVSMADLNDDDTPDIFAGSGVGGAPRVRVLDGSSATERSLADFFAFDDSETGGVRVTGVDSDGDDELEIIAGNSTNGLVRRFDKSGEELNEFEAFEDNAGVRVTSNR
ncbi:MAG: choice-of-anchor M domain-containing protein [Fimbriiglobus sp.]